MDTKLNIRSLTGRGRRAPGILTDAELGAIYDRAPSARLAEPMARDDLRDMLNEVATFLHDLAHDPGYETSPADYWAMGNAAGVLWALIDGNRPGSGCA